MITDKEKFIALMTEFGITPTEEEYGSGSKALVIEAKQGPKITGYTGFNATFQFDETTGAFIEMGIWE